MAYNRKPNYHFRDKNQTGIDKIPLGRMIIVEDYDGEVKTFLKKSNTGIDSSTTIENFAKSQDKNHSELVEYQKIQGAIGNINNPLLDLPLNNSLAMKQGVGSVTFSRTTKATYIDRYGVLQTADIDEPRFEKDGLLIEGASTNLLTYSEEFDNDVWTKTQCTVTANDTVAPDGTNTADKLSSSSNDDNDTLISQTYSTDVVEDDVYAVSVFVKKGNTDKITLSAYFKGENEYNYDFTFSTETASNSNMKVQKLDNGWYRLSYKIIATEDSDDAYVAARIWGIGRGVDGTTDDHNYVWGFQLEKLPFATSYIPTTDSAVTRGNDLCEVTAKDNIPIINEGFTFLMTYTSNSFIPEKHLIDFGSADRAGFIQQYGDAGFTYWNGSTDLTNKKSDMVLNSELIGRTARMGMVVINKLPYCIDDGIIIDNSLTREASISVPTTIKFGGGNHTNFGYIKNFKIWDKALTATEVALA